MESINSLSREKNQKRRKEIRFGNIYGGMRRRSARIANRSTVNNNNIEHNNSNDAEPPVIRDAFGRQIEIVPEVPDEEDPPPPPPVLRDAFGRTVINKRPEEMTGNETNEEKAAQIDYYLESKVEKSFTVNCCVLITLQVVSIGLFALGFYIQDLYTFSYDADPVGTRRSLHLKYGINRVVEKVGPAPAVIGKIYRGENNGEPVNTEETFYQMPEAVTLLAFYVEIVFILTLILTIRISCWFTMTPPGPTLGQEGSSVLTGMFGLVVMSIFCSQLMGNWGWPNNEEKLHEDRKPFPEYQYWGYYRNVQYKKGTSFWCIITATIIWGSLMVCWLLFIAVRLYRGVKDGFHPSAKEYFSETARQRRRDGYMMQEIGVEQFKAIVQTKKTERKIIKKAIKEEKKRVVKERVEKEKKEKEEKIIKDKIEKEKKEKQEKKVKLKKEKRAQLIKEGKIVEGEEGSSISEQDIWGGGMGFLYGDMEHNDHEGDGRTSKEGKQSRVSGFPIMVGPGGKRGSRRSTTMGGPERGFYQPKAEKRAGGTLGAGSSSSSSSEENS